MRHRRRPKQELRLPWAHTLIGKRGSVLITCLSFAALFVLVSHPALHPFELINPGADAQHACPLSHAAAALLIALPLLMIVRWPLGRLRSLLPWCYHSCFIHSLAPRPPPAQLS
jgi:hypothetical protein